MYKLTTIRSGGAMSWFLQRFTGIFLVIFLLVHFFILHFTGTGEITYANIAQKISQPFWKVFDLMFLAMALYHGLNGAWVVFEDYSNWLKNNKMRIFVLSVLLLAGLGAFALGCLTIIPFKNAHI